MNSTDRNQGGWAEEARERLAASGDDGFYQLCFCQTIDSTNEAVRRAALKGQGEAAVREGFLVVAEEQTAGRGRRGRTWDSPKGESLYFSFLLTPDCPVDKVSCLTLVMGLSAAQAVRTLFGLPVGIKWPNDLVIRGKKVCGILTEGLVNDGRLAGVIIGTGINVHTGAFPEEIRDRATSLYLELCAAEGPEAGEAEASGACGTNLRGAAPSKLSRAAVLAAVLHRFRINYGRFLASGDLRGLKDEYNALLVSRGKPVRVEDPAGSFTGIAGGIDEEGRLPVETEEGRTLRISSGEVSVRGLYGYV